MRKVTTEVESQPICSSEIDIEFDAVFYKTVNNTHAKLQRIGRTGFAFFYLNRPELEPVFIRDTARESIDAACKKQEVMSGTNDEMYNYFISN